MDGFVSWRAGACTAAFGVLLSGCSDDILFSCHFETLKEVASPNGKLVAIVFSTNCGATTAYTMEVSVFKKGETLPTTRNVEANVFVAERIAVEPGAIDVTWASNEDLNLAIPESARIFVDNDHVGAVRVTYREK